MVFICFRISENKFDCQVKKFTKTLKVVHNLILIAKNNKYKILKIKKAIHYEWLLGDASFIGLHIKKARRQIQTSPPKTAQTHQCPIWQIEFAICPYLRQSSAKADK